jgi:hypothetical protein
VVIEPAGLKMPAYAAVGVAEGGRDGVADGDGTSVRVTRGARETAPEIVPAGLAEGLPEDVACPPELTTISAPAAMTSTSATAPKPASNGMLLRRAGAGA